MEGKAQLISIFYRLLAPIGGHIGGNAAQLCGGGDHNTGFETVQTGETLLVLHMAQSVQHLTGHHAVSAAGLGEKQGRLNAVVGRKTTGLENETESLRLHGIPGQDSQGFAVDLMVGGLSAAQIVVVHAGQVFVDQRIIMHKLQGAGIGQGQMPVNAAQTGKLQRQHRADALSAGQEAVADRLLKPSVGLSLGGENAV